MNDSLYDFLIAVLPSFVMGSMIFIALKLYFNRVLTLFLKNESNRRTFELRKQQNNQFLQNKIQACERFAIYLERIHLRNLVTRITPTTSDTQTYAHTLQQIIDQEFDHNIAQQIYLQNNTYSAIKKAKEATKALIVQIAKNVQSANELQKNILVWTTEQEDTIPSILAMEVLKKELNY